LERRLQHLFPICSHGEKPCAGHADAASKIWSAMLRIPHSPLLFPGDLACEADGSKRGCGWIEEMVRMGRRDGADESKRDSKNGSRRDDKNRLKRDNKNESRRDG